MPASFALYPGACGGSSSHSRLSWLKKHEHPYPPAALHSAEDRQACIGPSSDTLWRAPPTICSFSSGVVGQTREGTTNHDCVRHTGQVLRACTEHGSHLRSTALDPVLAACAASQEQDKGKDTACQPQCRQHIAAHGQTGGNRPGGVACSQTRCRSMQAEQAVHRPTHGVHICRRIGLLPPAADAAQAEGVVAARQQAKAAVSRRCLGQHGLQAH